MDTLDLLDLDTPLPAPGDPEVAAVDLYWLPLGAGGQSVRFNGRVFEALAARTGSGSSATRSGAGGTDASPTSTRQSGARGD